MDLAPIALFTYNRLEHLEKTVFALQKNHLAQESELIIFSDAPKKPEMEKDVEAVRSYINSIKGFKKISIIIRNENYGLAKSIITGVTELITKYGKLIILEDDIITSVNFLQYMNDALEFYRNNKKIFSVSGYGYPIEIPENYKEKYYIFYRGSSWGWATWADRWIKADWEIKDYEEFMKDENAQKLFNRGGDDLTKMLQLQIEGKRDSWGIKWCYAHYKNDAFCIFPVISKTHNVGFDGTGVHCPKITKYDTIIDEGKEIILFSNYIEINEEVVLSIKKFLKS